MTINRYALLGLTSADATAHPAYSNDAVVVTPRSAREGNVISGFVMTGRFYEACTMDTELGESARDALRVVKRDVARCVPVRTVRPATIADVRAEVFGGL